MEFWTEVRRRVLTDELSKRAACREYELSWHTLEKILTHQEPPGYRQKQPRRKPKLEPFLPIIHEILQQDRQAPKKQRHTAWRILERLRDEHGFPGGYTIVKDAVRAWKQGHQEVFLPLLHPPGEAQVDFGEARIKLQGVETKVALFVMTLPYSGAIFVQAFPRECTEAFLEGHRQAFEFFGGVPRRISYDNSAIAVIEVLKGRQRKLTKEFLRLIDVCIANDHPTWTGSFGPGLPVEALRALAMQGSIRAVTCSRNTSAWCGGRTRRGTSSGCWATHVATSWCRCRRWPP